MSEFLQEGYKMTSKVTTPRACGIRCPYTGDEIDVYLTVGPAGVLYSCPGAFTLSEPVATLPELQDRASMRSGVHGLADGAVSPKCAYTGKPLLLARLSDGRFMYRGGFNPRRAYRDLDELLYWLTMRDGIPTRALPTGGTVPVESVEEPPKAVPDAAAVPSDATLETMENLAAQHMERGTMVSVAGKSGKSGKPAGKGHGKGK